MLNDFSRPSQLVEGAARASANGTSSVVFTVRASAGAGPTWTPSLNDDSKTADTAGGVLLHGDDLPDTSLVDSLLAREELLFFSSGGIEFQVTTRGTREARLTEEHVNVEHTSGAGGGYSQFEGRAALNPGFLFEAAEQLEVMLDFGSPPWSPTRIDSRVAMTLARECAEMAVNEADSPILSLHLPAAPYRDGSTRDRGSGAMEGIRDTHGLCLRMSIALVGQRTLSRLRFLEAIGRIAGEWGLGLHVSDRRPGRVRGEWITVRGFDPAKFAGRVREIGQKPPATPVAMCRPVTVVGPARIGSSLAVFDVLDRSGVGVTGLAVAALQEVAFINLVVVESDTAAEHVPSGSHPLYRGLQQVVLAATGRKDVDISRTGSGKLEAANDYAVLVGDPQPFVPDRLDQTPGRPLWMVWDVPYGRVDLEDVLRALGVVLSPEVETFVVQYARARLTGRGRIRGRAKVSAQPRSDRNYREEGGLRAHLGKLCELVERQIRMSVADTSQVPESEIRVRVMWRERWLGAWEDPM